MAAPETPEQPTGFGKFIQTYSSFLSSFVIGAAGLVATSIWQYRQSEIAQHQAEAQQRIAVTQADNNWRIERAEILAKNLGTLSASGQETVEARYGALLSLTRGNILDPELAVSYALELGKDNATYMKSVLASTTDKSWARLAGAFELTCQQRFGVARDVPMCVSEKHSERSDAIAELIAEAIDSEHHRADAHAHIRAVPAKEEPDASSAPARPETAAASPLDLLSDERNVQASPARYAAIFGHYIVDLFERRQLGEIQRFENASPGAHLVSALVLAPVQPNSFVASTEAAEIKAFHEARAHWLREYLFSKSCPGECKGKLVDIMLTSYAEAEGRYDAALRELFTHPRSEVAMALARLHARLLNCQVDPNDSEALRDHVLVPQLAAAAHEAAKVDPGVFEDLLSLLSLTPDPGFDKEPQEAARRAAWEAALTAARELNEPQYNSAFTLRRESAQATRKQPPAKLKPVMFCTADEVSLADVAVED